ncbi:Protein lingerer [Nymphon striatum]|nr:Protein lingerer [Nymphon striatum]
MTVGISPCNALDEASKSTCTYNFIGQKATAEQIRIAKLINDVKNTEADPELQAKVSQVMELTGKSSDDVIVALHDCDNDVQKAVNMLLEGSQDQGEWELSGKKKKNRQNIGISKPGTSDTVKNGNNSNNKENRNGGKFERNHDNKDKENTRNRGPPRLSRGKGWSKVTVSRVEAPASSLAKGRGRENEKNEKNLEDGQGQFRGNNLQRGNRSGSGPGRGRGGRGGPRSRTFENKAAVRDGFPRSIDTWTNSTAEQADTTGSNDATLTLKETKVFTASGTTKTQTQGNSTISNTTSESIDLVSLLPKPVNSNIENSTILNQSGQSPYLTQYQQKATETIKSAVGVGGNNNTSSTQLPNSQPSSTYSVGQNLSYRTSVGTAPNLNTSQKYPNAAAHSQRLPISSTQPLLTSRSKSQRTRLPPPSKIPASAVEMPDDAVGSLDVQFSGLEFGTESSGFDISSNNDSSSHYNASARSIIVFFSTTSSLSNHLTSSGNQSILSSNDNYIATTNEINSSGSSMNTSQPLTHLSQSGLNQTQKLNTTDPLMMSSQSSDATTAVYGNTRTTQPPGIEGVGNLNQTKPESSNLSGFGTSTASVLHQNNSLAYQTTYKNAPQLASSGANVNFSSIPTTQKSYATSNSSYAQPSSISSTYAVDQQDQSVYSVSDQTPSYQTQYQTSAFQPVSTYAPSPATYSTSNSVSSFRASPKLTESLTSDTSSRNQNPQNSYESSVSSTVDTLNTGSSTLSSSVPNASSSSVSLTGNSINVTALGLNSNTPVVTSSIASNSTGVKTMSSGKSIPNIPPGVPVLSPHQIIMSQGALPFYALQQPTAAGYPYEELQLLQSRLPPLASYYDVPFQPPTSLNAGRDGGLNSVPYSGENTLYFNLKIIKSGSDGKYSRGDSNTSPIPTSLSQQSSNQHQQQYINHTAAALPPGYGNYYYAVGGVMPNFSHQYSPIYPVQSATNAHGANTNTQFQKPGAYGSHTYSSASGVSVGSSAGSDMGGSVYNKTHSQLGKAQFDKPGFHAGTPPPFNLPGGVTAGAGHQTAGGPMGTAPSGHYATPTAPYMPMMAQHHISPAMLHTLQQDVSSGSSQRTGQSSSQQKGGTGSSNKSYTNNYWSTS